MLLLLLLLLIYIEFHPKMYMLQSVYNIGDDRVRACECVCVSECACFYGLEIVTIFEFRRAEIDNVAIFCCCATFAVLRLELEMTLSSCFRDYPIVAVVVTALKGIASVA